MREAWPGNLMAGKKEIWSCGIKRVKHKAGG